MSNALAIAAVSAVLKDLLDNAMIDHSVSSAVGDVTVSALPPDRVPTGSNEKSRLNLFLYHTTPNPGWRNVSLPSLDNEGQRLTNPPLAIDLHYLLTAYGEADFQAEILLGYAMQMLHETPVLSREAIRTALAAPSPVGGGILPPALQALSASELADQVEQIKLSPETLSTEESSRLWTALQAHYRPSAAYQASVVLIEGKKSTRSSLPVRSRNVYVQPFKQPVIEQVLSRSAPGQPILADQPITVHSALVLRGTNLQGDVTEVLVEGLEAALEDASDAQIILALPSGLRTGVRGVQVVHRIPMGTPEVPHRGVESNVAAFVLRPLIEDPAGGGQAPIRLENVTESGSLRSGDVIVKLNPKVGISQRVVLLLNEFESPPDRPARAYGFQAPPASAQAGASELEEVTIPIQGVEAGVYLVRVQVDGAESPLGVEEATGRYDSPKLEIP